MTSRFYYTYVDVIDSDVEFKASTFSSKARADLFVIQPDGTVTVFRGSLPQINLSVRPEDIILNGEYLGLFENGTNLTNALEAIVSVLSTHTANKNNPHEVTAAQIGLGTSSSPAFAGINVGAGSNT